MSASIQEMLGCDIILLMGAPLSGKGTQGTLLSKILERPCVSTGDLFRAEIGSGTALGAQMRGYMDAGELIPNELTTTFLTQKLSDPVYQNGLILDGYPRNLSHFPIFESIMHTLDRAIFAVLYSDVPKRILDERRKSRGRIDDSSDISERRYQVFLDETIPLIESLKSKCKVITIDYSEESPEEIHQRIMIELLQLKENSLTHLDSYQWLDAHLTINNPNKADIISEFRKRALEENEKQGRRTGMLRRIIYLRTGNTKKYHEHVQIFEKLYGIEVIRVPSRFFTDGDESNAIILLSATIPGIVQLAVITERSNLYRPSTNILSSLHHNVRTINRSKLTAIWLNSTTKETLRSEFIHDTPGRIDLVRRRVTSQLSNSAVFGWDDIFVVEATGMTYQQLKEMGIKHSARDMVISAFLKERIHYKELLNVSFDPPAGVTRAIDFSVDVAEYVATNITYTNPKVTDYGFYNLIIHVLNTGVFFRAANNRRQVNYWNPGLNGGLPLTAKDDQIHQDTFMAHDFGHFAIPDLVFIGHTSVLHRRIYIAWRMISEAMTMTLADMLLVDGLVKSGVTYDFDKRRIYPLFRDLKIDLTDPSTRLNNLKRIIHANYKYCLLGNDTIYAEMLPNGKDTPSLIEFKKKFGPFFVEDFRWTEHNYDNMVSRSEEIARWWEDIEPIRTMKYAENIQSIDDFLMRTINTRPDICTDLIDEFVDTIFDIVFETKIEPVLNPQPSLLLSQDQRLFKAFTKWMSGQLAITSKFHFLPESEQVRKKIMTHLLSLSDGKMTMDDVTVMRAIYEEYLHYLADKNLISHDDEKTFAELYPLFDPFYVNYDKGAGHYEDLTKISSRIFSIEDYRNKQLIRSAQSLGRPLTSNETIYGTILLEMIEAGHGQVVDGMFVTRPGVMILSESPIAHPRGMVTFLISGISVETSLELVAHHEAKVARLTSSKTKAMNVPLYCVQGQDTLQQRRFLTELIHTRTAFESTYQPREQWGENGNELFNMMLPACKATVVCYTMTLADFHKMFIGRMSKAGNELEVIHVAQRMATALNKLYPTIIRDPQEYINCNNTKKYVDSLPSIFTANTIVRQNQAIILVEKSRLTLAATRLMDRLNLHEGNDCDRLAEFRSRITYLAFPKSPLTVTSQKTYLSKIIDQHGHWSVLDASQIIFQFSKDSIDAEFRSFLEDFTQLEENQDDTLIFMTMKQWRQILLRSEKMQAETHQNILTTMQSFIQE